MSKLKISLIGIGVVLALIAIPIGLMFLTGNISMLTASFRGEVKAQEIIKASGTFKIQAYQGFFDKCESIRASEANIRGLEMFGLDTLTKKERTELRGLINIRNNRVADYNAKSHAEWTAGQFRDERLPYTIELDRRSTTCE